MERNLTMAIALLVGGVLGAVGMKVVSAATANTAAFQATAVSASSVVNFTSYAWIVGQDGSARFCVGQAGGGPANQANCVPVKF